MNNKMDIKRSKIIVNVNRIYCSVPEHCVTFRYDQDQYRHHFGYWYMLYLSTTYLLLKRCKFIIFEFIILLLLLRLFLFSSSIRDELFSNTYRIVM